MEADDVAPSRLAAAEQSAQAFLDTVPDTINVGLVKFSGSATVLVPPTTDHARVSSAIDDLQLGEGTGIGEAIFASLDALGSLPDAADPDEGVPATIIVLSDGETTQGRPNEEGVAAAQAAEIPVSTIAFGTDAGQVIIQGDIVPVPPQRDELERIADDTGGVFFDAEDEGQLTAAYEDLGSSIGFETEQEEVGQWFVGAALVALTAAAALSLLWFSRLP
jgi:Ca-activated chloride channel family protein